MLIAISGKGGSGKTTIAGTLARSLGQRGQPVLAIDGDPNPTLALTLGIPHTEADRIPALPTDVLEVVAAPDGTRTRQLRLPVPALTKEYGTTAADDVTLLIGGRVEHAARGCMCNTHAAIRTILKELLSSDQGITLADMEAGIEHLSRATLSNLDVLLVVVEPFYKSIYTAEKVVALARELGIPRIVGVANKVRDDAGRAAIAAACERWGIEIIAEIPFDEALRDAEQARKAPIDVAPESPAVRAVRDLADTLVPVAV
ncbi:MAG TPA: AAA family ATPase [Candidatus Sulfotelmatobacter sp.]|nr:AAA family ATPase [Candidatus Sulfotelmatobacter sp.]